MGVTYQEVVENELLSDEVIADIPETCECGGLIEFTDTLRQIYCTNPRCAYKIASRLETMAKALNVDGFGEANCIEICKTFKLISPYQVFLLEKKVKEGQTCNVATFEKKITDICNLEIRKKRLWEVVQLGGLPGIDTIAYKLFSGYNSIEEAYNDFEYGEVPFIAEKLGVKNYESGVLAVNVYNTLMEYKQELLFAEKQFIIQRNAGISINIAITHKVHGFKNKPAFIEYLNNRYNGVINAVWAKSVTHEVDILVADGDTSSNKYVTATDYNNKHIEKLIESGDYEENKIGQFEKETDLHPYGEAIMIGTGAEVISRLDRYYMNNKESM